MHPTVGDRVKIINDAPHKRDCAHREALREKAAEQATRLGKDDAEARHAAHLQHRIKTGQHEGKHNKPCHEHDWQVVLVKGDRVWIAELEDGKPTDRVKIVSLAEIEKAK